MSEFILKTCLIPKDGRKQHQEAKQIHQFLNQGFADVEVEGLKHETVKVTLEFISSGDTTNFTNEEILSIISDKNKTINK